VRGIERLSGKNCAYYAANDLVEENKGRKRPYSGANAANASFKYAVDHSETADLGRGRRTVYMGCSLPVLKDESIQKQYGQESAFKEKRLQAAFYNKFSPIPAKTRYESLLLTPYAKAVPKVILTGDANTVFRATEEETAKKIAEAAK
jgi:hypothetical protein